MIKVVKLLNGEEIIAKVEASGVGYSMKDPAAIVIQQTAQGVGVALAPYMPYANGDITLYSSSIGTEGSPTVAMENEYNRIFGSGIQIASSFK